MKDARSVLVCVGEVMESVNAYLRILFCNLIIDISAMKFKRASKKITHIYRGPSVAGYICEPRTLPHCPMAMNIGMPVAFFDSEARLWASVHVGCAYIMRREILTNLSEKRHENKYKFEREE